MVIILTLTRYQKIIETKLWQRKCSNEIVSEGVKSSKNVMNLVLAVTVCEYLENW